MSDRWIVAVAAAHFHPDEGQVLDFVYPPAALSESERRDAAFCAFPDSVSSLEDAQSRTSVRDSTFFFRIRRSAPAANDASPSPSPSPPPPSSIVPSERVASDAIAAAAPAPPAVQPSPSRAYAGAPPPCGFLYGWVFCRQRRDARVRRGAEQRAVIVLADAPRSGALAALARAAGAAHFNEPSAGGAALAALFDDVDRTWPPPSACVGAPAWVGAGGLAMAVQAPDPSVLPPPAPPPPACPATGWPPDPAAPLPRLVAVGGDATTAAPTRPAPPSAYADVCAWAALAPILPHAWQLWEATLLASPTLVLGRTPAAAGRLVAALVSLISPLPYSADFRPYLTIHDAAATALVDAGAAGVAPARSTAGHLPRLVGATNPFFVRALGGAWPTVVSAGGGRDGSGGAPPPPPPAAAAATAAGPGGGPPAPPPPPSASMLAPPNTSPSRLRRAASVGAAFAGAAAGAAAAALRTAASAAARRNGAAPTTGALASHPAAAAALASGRAPPAVWSALPKATRPDKELMAALRSHAPKPGAPLPPPGTPAAEAAAAAAASASAALRSHFWRLTSGLLSLFDDAFVLGGPPPGDGPLPAGGPPPPPPFSHTEFLARIAGRSGGGPPSPVRTGDNGVHVDGSAAKPAPPLPLLPIPPDLLARFGGSRPALTAFLRRFLASPNFSAWFERRRAAARARQAAEWEAACLVRGEGKLPEDMDDVELFDAWAGLEARLASASAAVVAAAGSPAEPAAAARLALLRKQAARVYAAMRADLKAALLSVPARAATVRELEAEGGA